jgi:hypothetical protein
MKMEKNIGGMERMVRVVLGIALLALMFMHQIGSWGWLGLILIVTGMISFCPIYKLFRR